MKIRCLVELLKGFNERCDKTLFFKVILQRFVMISSLFFEPWLIKLISHYKRAGRNKWPVILGKAYGVVRN